MASSTEIFFIIILAIGVAVSVWYFIVAKNHRSYLDTTSYVRGASVKGEGTTINMKCDGGKKICVYRARQICSAPDSNNFENQSTDPISPGDTNTFYGDFNPKTTVDYISKLSGQCNGKETCSVEFDPLEFPMSDPNGICTGENVHLISTYTCVADGASCTSADSTS